MKTSFVVSVVVCVAISALAVSGFAEANGCYRTPSDILAFWPAEGNAKDVAGVFEGFLAMGVNFAPGMVRQAFNFPPSALWVAVGSPEGESFTIEAWVFLAADASGWQVIYVGTHGFYLVDGKAAWWHGGIRFEGTSLLSTGVWHHVAITYDDATDTFTGYFDGQPDGTSTSADNYLPYGPTIGYGNGAADLNGKIDELAVYGRALEPSEIQGIFDAGSAGKDLIFRGRFEIGNTSRWLVGDDP
jgi:hypothetical protein